MKQRNFIIRQWKACRIFVPFFALIGILITYSNLSSAAESGKPIPWGFVLVAIAMILFATIIGELARRWFNFMLGSSDCEWWSSK